MVGVVVRHERAGEAQAVGREQVDELADAVRRVDHDRLARLAVADEVDEVHHLARQRVVAREVGARQQLAEVEPVLGLVPAHELFASSPSRPTNAPGSLLLPTTIACCGPPPGKSGGAYHSKPSPSMASTTDCAASAAGTNGPW